jgi:hypothetical protein
MALDPIRERHPAILLSASIPTPDRPARYFDTADVIAIRDCIKALVGAAIPNYALIWGGHPSITPMIRLLAESYPRNVVDRFVLYQSRMFQTIAPKDNDFFQHVIWVDGSPDLEKSLQSLRSRMLTEPNYIAGVFIGGMDGIEKEFDEFRRINPTRPAFPIASTGGAARLLYGEWSRHLNLPRSLEDEIAYPFLFRQLLSSLDK